MRDVLIAPRSTASMTRKTSMSELQVSHHKEAVRRGRRVRKKLDLLLPGMDGTEPASEKSAEPARLDYRAELAEWPLKWRERWGRRANALEDQGLKWKEAEVRAFIEIWRLRQEKDAVNGSSAHAARN